MTPITKDELEQRVHALNAEREKRSQEHTAKLLILNGQRDSMPEDRMSVEDVDTALEAVKVV